MKLSKIKRGFTLIEILLVVSILSVILVVVFAALNPGQRLQDARDSRRWNDVNQILTAIHECIVDGGSAAGCSGVASGADDMATVGTQITGCASAAGGCATADADCADLDAAIGPSAGTPYLGAIPIDPSSSSTTHTGYVIENAGGIITVRACSAEGGSNILVTR